MSGPAWFIGILAAVGMIVVIGASYVPWYARYRAYQHAVYLRLDLPSRLERVVGARLMARERGAGIGGFVFTVAAILVLTLWSDPLDDALLGSWFVVGALLAGAGVGTAVAALITRGDVAPGRPRVARAGAVAVRDYVAPFERIGARVVVVLAVAAWIVVTAVDVPDDGALALGLAFFAVAGAVTLVLFEVASRRIVDVPQPAGSTAELVWDDAIRASALRDLLTGPLALGTYGLVFGAVGLGAIGNSAASAAAFVGGGIVVASLVVNLIVGFVSRPARYFLDRLWADLRWSDTADTAATATDAA